MSKIPSLKKTSNWYPMENMANQRLDQYLEEKNMLEINVYPSNRRSYNVVPAHMSLCIYMAIYMAIYIYL